ncbi:MAG: PmoA family protein [Verrucomicrobiales bacterium]
MRACLFIFCLMASAHFPLSAADVLARHDTAAKKVTVQIGGEVFTEYVYNTYAKPVLYPVIGPGAVPMTRDWPMKDASPGEDKDHPHQKSIWFTHGAVNGVDFWAEGPKSGKIVTDEITQVTTDQAVAVIDAKNQWKAPDGKTVCSDTTTIRCGEDRGARFIDYIIRITATHGDVTFGDTKEGTMGIRTRPELQLNPEKNRRAAGQAVNSEGNAGKAIWAEKARWIHYWAPVSGKTLGVAVFDHPSNLRHPTTWHARDYGLIAANPFGLHDFSRERLPKEAGNFTIKAGETQTWRYRFLFQEGESDAAKIDERWKKWAKSE